mgnify:CR=1 FL=1
MIEQFLRKFDHGEKWYVDSYSGDDQNDGRSWATAKKTIQAALNSAGDGDVVIIRGYFAEDIIIQGKSVMIHGVGNASILGTYDTTKPIITVDNAPGIAVVGCRLGAEHNADCSCVLLDNIDPGEQNDKIVEVFGGVDSVNEDSWIGGAFNQESLSGKLIEKYFTTIAQMPQPDDTTLIVNGNIAVEPWLSVKKFMQEGHAFIPAYITRHYENIVYDSDNDVSIISGIDPPFTEDTIPNPDKNRIYLCAIKVRPSMFSMPHFAGEQIVDSSRNLKRLISIAGLSINPVLFVSCEISSLIFPTAELPIPAANVVFDSCYFVSFSIGRYPFNIICFPINPFVVRNSVFIFAEGSGICNVTGLSSQALQQLGAPFNKDFRDILKGSGIFHSVISVVSFGNFDATPVREWFERKIGIKLVIGKEVMNATPGNLEVIPMNITLPFAENLWIKYAMSGFTPIVYEVVTSSELCPTGDIANEYKDKSPLRNIGGIEEVFAYDASKSITKSLKMIK